MMKIWYKCNTWHFSKITKFTSKFFSTWSHWKDVQIPQEKINLAFSRSGGAGGQNVNKINTKVELRFKLDEAEWLDFMTKQRLREIFPNRINSEGEFISEMIRFDDIIVHGNQILSTWFYASDPYPMYELWQLNQDGIFEMVSSEKNPPSWFKK